MKKFLNIFAIVFLPSLALSQTPSENYIRSTNYQVETSNGLNKAGSTVVLTNNDKIEIVTYYDGLGRTKQIVNSRAGGNQEDLITPFFYDYLGRKTKDYLPYPRPKNNLYDSSREIDTRLFPDFEGYSFEHNNFYKNEFPDDFVGVGINEVNGFSIKRLEASPLNRIREQAAPGKDWALDWNINNSHTIRFDYLTNNTSTEVRNYKVNLIATTINNIVILEPSLVLSTVNNGYYVTNELYKNITKDENWTSTLGKNHTTEEFKDKLGKIVLKRTYNAGVEHDTYYVYDDFGNLTYVIPPKADGTTSAVVGNTVKLNELCYQYKYDNKNRLVEKKVPGKGWEYIVYNKLDQPILTQDAVQALKSPKEWLFTKYDAFGRVAYTGLIKTNLTRAQHQGNVNAANIQFENWSPSALNYGGGTFYYTDNSYPDLSSNATNVILYTVNYFDDYRFYGINLPSIVYGELVMNHNNATTIKTRGMATGSKVRVLGETHWITTVMGYDSKGRMIYTMNNNSFLATSDEVKLKLDFPGKILETTGIHSKVNKPTITVIDYLNYDHMGRLTKQTQKINNQPEELLAYNAYDKLGQLKSKKVGGVPTGYGLQTVNYAYNIRGWLKQINDPGNLDTDLFAFKINYNTVEHGGTKLYNGNIAETKWKTQSDNQLRWYRYGYDHLNRITSGIDNTTDSRYSLVNVGYDKNGNIMNLNRKGHIVANPVSTNPAHFGTMDNLTYNYHNSEVSNRLSKITDASGYIQGFKDGSNTFNEYTYDLNGNMTRDFNKGILGPNSTEGITYNHLNLPTLVNMGGGNIEYIYDATGVKQKKIVSSGTTTEYAGNYNYQGNTLQFFNHPEGYVENNAGTYKYHYQYKDHLGNVRVSYTNNGTATSPSVVISEENNYYPFGLKHKGYNDNPSPIGNSAAKKYKFNGVELEEFLGLDLYEMDVRSYDHAIGRFTSIDPVTHFDYSTYSAFDNNPVFWADPSGADSACNTCGDAKDMWGRERYSEWGMYIPPHQRNSAEQESYIDKVAVKALKTTAEAFGDGVDLSNLTEREKQKIFKEDELGTIAILLWEFATGTGREVRKFSIGVHPFASRLMEGRILEEIVSKFNTELKAQGYDFKSAGDTGIVPIALEFSPSVYPSTWLKSLQKHTNSNASQFFVGGAIANVKIQDRNLKIQIYNETSRNSLMLHIARNYDRKNGNVPLSTIKQYIYSSYDLNK